MIRSDSGFFDSDLRRYFSEMEFKAAFSSGLRLSIPFFEIFSNSPSSSRVSLPDRGSGLDFA
jgi:hypothetical protein